MNDNGAEILKVHRSWLDSEERGKVEIALAMEEVFPGQTRDEMVFIFSRITSRWPDLKLTCNAFLEVWDKQFGI